MQKINNDISSWINDNWKYAFTGLHPSGEANLIPTCFAVLASESCGLLRNFTPKRKAEIADSILKSQSEQTGFFSPGRLLKNELTNHSATYINMQATYFALHALDALEMRPRYLIHFAKKLQDISYLYGWMDGGPWNNPWLHSNNIMFALTFLQTDNLWTNDNASLDAYDSILCYLNKRQDETTGLWLSDNGIDLETAVYAGYHFLPYYLWRGIPLHYPESIINSALAIQKNDGLFGTSLQSGSCEDLDAVHTLVLMSHLTNHRKTDINKALDRCFARIIEIQNADGGFPNIVKYPSKLRMPRTLSESISMVRLFLSKFQEPIWFYSGWQRLSCPISKSDMWSAWFRPLTLKLIVDHYSDNKGLSEHGSYRRLPGLGWHNAATLKNAR